MIAGLPYDCEIEYLESVGGQYIDTGRNFGNTDRVLLSSSVSKAGTASYWCFFGANSSNNEVLMWWRGNTYSYLNGKTVSTPFQYNVRHVLDLVVTKGAASLSLDGVEYGTSTGNNNGKNIYLFGTITGQSSTDNTVGNFNYQRVYSCKLWQGQTLVLDFIPVRVGQTGYMYDRVTKRLFGNKGTGSFVLGPDVATPVMGVIKYPKFYNAGDYVQDGLVSQWDGIQSISGTSFKDLVSGTLVNNSHLSNVHGLMHYSGIEAVQLRTNLPSPSDTTIELCLNVSNFEAVGTNRTEMVYCFGYIILLGYSKNWAFSVRGSYRPYGSNSVRMFNSSLIIKNTPYSTYARTVSPYFNGTASLSPEGANNPSNTILTIGRNTYSNIDMDINSIRIYNRALTADEIAHNYSIDKARFNLP